MTLTRVIPILFFTALLSLSVSADDAETGPLILGKGTNLAHWLSQTRRTGEERRDFITEKDIAYIAELGFDHVRLPLDEHQMWDEEGNRDEVAFAILHDAIRWSLEHDLLILIDLHILRSHHFNVAESRCGRKSRRRISSSTCGKISRRRCTTIRRTRWPMN